MGTYRVNVYYATSATEYRLAQSEVFETREAAERFARIADPTRGGDRGFTEVEPR